MQKSRPRGPAFLCATLGARLYGVLWVSTICSGSSATIATGLGLRPRGCAGTLLTGAWAADADEVSIMISPASCKLAVGTAVATTGEAGSVGALISGAGAMGADITGADGSAAAGSTGAASITAAGAMTGATGAGSSASITGPVSVTVATVSVMTEGAVSCSGAAGAAAMCSMAG